MLVGARLAGVWHHARAHRFFSHARWSPEELGLLLSDLVLARLTEPGAALVVPVDDTLLHRLGRKVQATFWHHDATADSDRSAVASGNNWVVVGIDVKLPFLARTVCLPILFRLWQPKRKHIPKGKPDPERPSKPDAALYEPAPPRTGKRGRPALKGERLPSLAQIATGPATAWQTIAARRYGKTARVEVHLFECLWPGALGYTPVQVLLVRDTAKPAGYQLALLTTDLDANATQLIERYSDRWPIEVAFEEGKQLAGVGEARNRTRRAVERTVPFQFHCMTIAILWYALYGHHPADVDEHRARAPWYRPHERCELGSGHEVSELHLIDASVRRQRPDVDGLVGGGKRIPRPGYPSGAVDDALKPRALFAPGARKHRLDQGAYVQPAPTLAPPAA